MHLLDCSRTTGIKEASIALQHCGGPTGDLGLAGGNGCWNQSRFRKVKRCKSVNCKCHGFHLFACLFLAFRITGSWFKKLFWKYYISIDSFLLSHALFIVIQYCPKACVYDWKTSLKPWDFTLLLCTLWDFNYLGNFLNTPGYFTFRGCGGLICKIALGSGKELVRILRF